MTPEQIIAAIEALKASIQKERKSVEADYYLGNVSDHLSNAIREVEEMIALQEEALK